MAANTRGDEFSQLIQSKNYGQQAIWFLNGFWNRMDDVAQEAENIWQFAQQFIELDPQNEEGCELDEFQAHQFLEKQDETMTVMEMRQRMREIDQDSNGKMALLEYLVYRYPFTVDETVAAPQGSNEEEVAKAQAMFEEVSHALTAQRAAVAELEAAEAELEAAEAELQSAMDDLHREEEAYHGAIAACEEKINDESLGVVKKNRAKAELAQLQAEDPMPLRRAKITQGAAIRRVGKEKKKVQEKKGEAEAKQAELEAKLEEASAELEKVKQQGGSGEGVLWWLGRVEFEADKYLPRSKQKFDHSKEYIDIRAPPAQES